MFKKESWNTNLLADADEAAIPATEEIILSKPVTGRLFPVILSMLSLMLIGYVLFSGRFEWGFIAIFIAAGFIVFLFFSMKDLFSRSTKIIFTSTGILLSQTEVIKWEDITETYIERRAYYFTKGSATLERFYLNIATVYSGQFSGKATIRSVEITGLNASPNQVSTIMEVYKERFKNWA